MTRTTRAAAAPGHAPSAWWRPWKIALAIVAALLLASAAFAYRFNPLGGSLGGFDNDHFAHLMRTENMLHGEQPLRDFADSELRGAWPSLSYAVPAWAHRIGGHNLLSEAYLTAGALAVAHALVFVLALDLSKRWSVALLATLLAVATGPKLYNYPKVLMLTLGAAAIRLLMVNPSAWRLFAAAVVTAAAALFRHDYAVYVAMGVVAALIARDAAAWRSLFRQLVLYAGFTALLLLPSAGWVQVYEGIPTYINRALQTSQAESSRTELSRPALDLAQPFARDTLLAFTYYAFWAVLCVSVVLLLWRLAARSHRLLPADRGMAIGLLAMAAIVNIFFLRANLGQRFGDAIVPTVLLAAWSAGAAGVLAARATRGAVAMAAPLVLAVMLAAVYVSGEVGRELESGALAESWEHATERFERVRTDLRTLPPGSWEGATTDGTLAAARYVAECTAPDDRLLVAGYAPEIPVFARRRFAAGQATVSLAFYTSDADQQRALDRLRQQSVPVILADDQAFEEEFASDYPVLAAYVRERYRHAGTIPVDDEPGFRVYVEANRTPVRTDAALGLPCFR